MDHLTTGWFCNSLRWLSERVTLGVILCGAAAARLAAILILRNFHDPVLYEYGIISRYLLAGQGYAFYTVHGQPLPSAFMPPAYAYFLAGMFRIFGDGTVQAFLVSQLLHAAMGVLLVYLVYRIAQIFWSRELALLSALLAAFYPPFVYMCTRMANISFYLTINVAVFYFISLYLFVRPRTGYLVAAGLLSGLLVLFRAETLSLGGIVAVLVLYKLHRAFRDVVVFLWLALAVIAPWTVRNYLVFRRFIPTTTAMPIVLWYGHNSQSNGTQRIGWGDASHVMQPLPPMQAKLDRVPISPQYEIAFHTVYLQEALQFIRTHPREEIILLGEKFVYYWTFDMHHPNTLRPGYWVPALLLVALFWTGVVLERRKLFASYYLFVTYVLFSMTLALVFHVLPRYRMFVEPLMIPLAAVGVLHLYAKLTGTAKPALQNATDALRETSV
jgi:4-amino-4-deoxy-L-arabinose transferase-like glycosyltransferase